MGDLLIRGVPDNVIAALDAKASQLGLSRTEYLRRRLAADASGRTEVSTSDLHVFADAFADLADPSLMDAAWL